MQDVRFARSADGVGIAYAIHGSGPPLLIDACWLSHLQFDWQSPVWRHFLVELGRIATVIRYDERGHGLSDRGVIDHGLEARVADLEAVADDAGLERFALMGMGQGGPVAIEYAARHPERVTRLIFYGSFAGLQPPATPEEIELYSGVSGADQGGLGPTHVGVSAGFQQPADTRRHRGTDALARRPTADGGGCGHRGAGSGGTSADRFHCSTARAGSADLGAAQPRRPDERVRPRPAAGREHQRRAVGGVGNYNNTLKPRKTSTYCFPDGLFDVESELGAALKRLPDREQWAAVEMLTLLTGTHTFVACKPARGGAAADFYRARGLARARTASYAGRGARRRARLSTRAHGFHAAPGRSAAVRQQRWQTHHRGVAGASRACIARRSRARRVWAELL